MRQIVLRFTKMQFAEKRLIEGRFALAVRGFPASAFTCSCHRKRAIVLANALS